MKEKRSKVIIIAIVLLFMTAAAFGKDGPAPGWNWTKENPKPAWFTWGKEYWPEEPVRGGYIKLAASRYIGLMNPNHWPVNDWYAMTMMYDLMIYNIGDYRPKAYWLVESLDYTSPKTVVLKLRQGVKFHDGADFNAAAVKYQAEWIKNKENGAWSRAWLEPLESVDIIDEYTVRFNTTRVWAALPGMLTQPPFYAISPKALQKDVALKNLEKLERRMGSAQKKVKKYQAAANKKEGEAAQKARKKHEKAQRELAEMEKELTALKAETAGAEPLDNHAVGAGKFMLEEASPGNYLKLKRNPNWWFGKSIGRPDMPHADGMIFTVIPDPSVQLANLRSGEIDMMGLTMAQYNMVKNDSKMSILKAYWPHTAALRFNTTQGPCQDLRVRKAISHAIDRKALIQGIQFGHAIPAAGMFPTRHWCSNPELKPVDYNPELSKKLLAEAGYDDGLTITGYISNLPEPVSIAEAVKGMLSEVGVTWEVSPLAPAAASDRMRNLEYDLATGGWAYVWDPDMMCTGLYHPDGGFNYGRSNNPRIIELLEAGRVEIDEAKRQKIYRGLEKVVYDDYQDAWLWHPVTFTALGPRVAGYNEKLQLEGLEGFWHSHPIWLKKGGKK